MNASKLLRFLLVCLICAGVATLIGIGLAYLLE